MARIKLSQNPRVITIFLLLLTLALAAIAIVTAISLNKRQNVNPDKSNADSSVNAWFSQTWADNNYNCRTDLKPQNGKTQCAKAEFTNYSSSSLGNGQMLYCGDEIQGNGDLKLINGLYYGRWRVGSTASYLSECMPTTTEAQLCSGKGYVNGGNNNGVSCGNPYKCTPPPAPPSLPTPNDYEVLLKTTCTDGPSSGQQIEFKRVGVIRDRDEQGLAAVENKTVSIGGGFIIPMAYREPLDQIFPATVKVENLGNTDGLTIQNTSCSGVGNKGTCNIEFTGCKEATTPTPAPTKAAVTCDGLTITDLSTGARVADQSQIKAGNTYRLSVAGNTPNRFGTRYAVTVDSVGYIIMNPDQSPTSANKGNNFNDQYTPSSVDFKVPASFAGKSIRFSAANIYNLTKDSSGSTIINPNPVGVTLKDNYSAANVVSCGTNSGVGRRAIYGNTTYPVPSPVNIINGSTGVTSTNTHTYYQGQGFQGDFKTSLQNELGFTCTETSSCTQTFTVAQSSLVCTGLTLSNNNPKQGDTITATITTNQTAPAGTTYSINGGTASSSATINVQIPNNQSLSTFSIQGYINGVNQGATCAKQITFAPRVVTEKSIANIQNPVSSNPPTVDANSIVQYNVAVSNTGGKVLQNVRVADFLTGYQNNTPVSPPAGDITNASNLVAAPIAPKSAANSTPASVAPAVPSGNGPYAAGTKRVEWSPISLFQPGDKFSGTVTVDILPPGSQTSLKNTVCLYTDTNGNGQYDTGEEIQPCAEVIVYLVRPDVIVQKTAVEVNTNNPVTGLAPGDTFRYKVTVTNTGSQNLTNVVVQDTLQQSIADRFTVINNGGATVSGSSNNIFTWTIPTLNAGQTIDLYLTLQIKSDFFRANESCSITVNNVVNVTSTAPTVPPVLGSQISITIAQNCSTSLVITKVANPTIVGPNAIVTYSGEIRNNGDRNEVIDVIQDNYSTGFTYVAGSASFVKPDASTFAQEPDMSTAGRLFWNLGSNQVTLTPGQSMTYTYQMKAASSTGTYPNTICIPDSNNGNPHPSPTPQLPSNPGQICATAQVVVTRNPGTGLGARKTIIILGIGLVATSFAASKLTRRRQTSLKFARGAYRPNPVPRASKGFSEKVDSIINKLKK